MSLGKEACNNRQKHSSSSSNSSTLPNGTRVPWILLFMAIQRRRRQKAMPGRITHGAEPSTTPVLSGQRPTCNHTNCISSLTTTIGSQVPQAITQLISDIMTMATSGVMSRDRFRPRKAAKPTKAIVVMTSRIFRRVTKSMEAPSVITTPLPTCVDTSGPLQQQTQAQQSSIPGCGSSGSRGPRKQTSRRRRPPPPAAATTTSAGVGTARPTRRPPRTRAPPECCPPSCHATRPITY